jgi:hypothetical protein
MITDKEIEQERSPLSLQEQLDQTLRKYEFIHTNEHSVIQWHIIQTARRIPQFEKVAIWGAGKHTAKLLELFGDLISISFIIDSDPSKQGAEMMGFQIKEPEAIENDNITLVIVSTLFYRSEIKTRLETQYPLVKQIDFYDIYNGSISTDEIFPFYQDMYINFWLDIHLLRSRIELEKDTNTVETLYKWLLSYLIDIKDFKQFDQVVQKYIQAGFSDAEHIGNLNADIGNLLNHAKEVIRHRKKKDIILFIFDSMRQRDVTQCPSLMKMANQSVTFSSAFSPSTYTKGSYIGMFNGSEINGAELFTGKADGSKSSFIQWLENNNYSLFQYGGPEFKQVNNMKHLELGNLCSISNYWWESLCQLYSLETPQFHLIHAMETHFPFLCAKHNGMVNSRYTPQDYLKGHAEFHKESVSQYKEVLSYVDTMFGDIQTFLSENTMIIVCSDHGGAMGGTNPTGHLIKCSDEYIHVPFFVHHKDLVPETYDELFSMTKFDSMLVKLLENKKADESLFSSEVIVERDSIYRSGWLSDHVVVENLGVWRHAFKMVRNSMYKFVLFENGHERLYALYDESNNIAADPQYHDILQELRSKITSDFSKYKTKKNKEGDSIE